MHSLNHWTTRELSRAILYLPPYPPFHLHVLTWNLVGERQRLGTQEQNFLKLSTFSYLVGNLEKWGAEERKIE